MNKLRTILGAAVIAAMVLLIGMAGSASATQGDPHQVVVCKYVGTPGTDERLQTGQNPIVVDSAALEKDGFNGTFPFAFEDAQGNSIAIRWAANSHDGDISECPGYVAPTPSPTVEPTPSVEPTPEPSVTPTPEPSVTPSETPSEQPSSTPKAPRPQVTAPPTDTIDEAPASSGTVGLGTLALLLGSGLIGGALTLARVRTRR